MTTMTHSARGESPTRWLVRPTATLDGSVEVTSRPKPAERVFEIQSPNGYARTVAGTIEYLDDEARTYVVRTRAGEFVRVPMRDITSERGILPGDEDIGRPGAVVAGTGLVWSGGRISNHRP